MEITNTGTETLAAGSALVVGAVLALLSERSVTLAQLAERTSRIGADATETKAAIEYLCAVTGQVSVTLQLDRGRGTMASTPSVDFILRRSTGRKCSLSGEITALLLAMIAGKVQRGQEPTLVDFLKLVPREEGGVRLSALVKMLAAVISAKEVRQAVELLIGGGLCTAEYVAADVLIAPVDPADWRLPSRPAGPTGVQVTATVPDPKQSQQVAATGGETIISRAVGAITGRKRQAS